MKHKITSLFLASAALGAITGQTSDAKAWWVRQHASICYNNSSTASLTDGEFGIKNTSGSSQILICPVPDNSSMPKTAVVNANVEFWVGNSASPVPQAAACTADFHGQFGACSVTLSAPSGTGTQDDLSSVERLGTRRWTWVTSSYWWMRGPA